MGTSWLFQKFRAMTGLASTKVFYPTVATEAPVKVLYPTIASEDPVEC